jgi:hypothetical protein
MRVDMWQTEVPGSILNNMAYLIRSKGGAPRYYGVLQQDAPPLTSPIVRCASATRSSLASFLPYRHRMPSA